MEAPIHPKSIVILDFGGQYAHLIARRVREAGAFSEIRQPSIPVSELKDAAGIILSGGPQSVYDSGSPQADPNILELGIPVLGICYGHQWIAHTLGGTVTSGKTKEYGKAMIRIRNQESGIMQGLPEQFTVWMSHGDEVATLPEGFINIATSGDCMNAAMADASRKIYGVQFHLEVVHTEHGAEIIQQFVSLTDHAPWSVESYAQRIGDEVKKDVGDLPSSVSGGMQPTGKRVFMMVSGGVDSTVAFTVINEVLGSHRVQGLLVDTGLLRKHEAKNIMDAFDLLGIENLEVVDASDEFFEHLKGIYDPEMKRQIIGDRFLAVQKRISEEMHLRIEDGWMLGQGTIYPDTIETGGTQHADRIKTHHNRVEAVQKMIEAGLIIEPLKDLYKDEVRKLGEEIGLPHDLVWRHPFPGPGLGVRILCAESELEIENEELKIDLPHVVLPVRSVGVQGDGRTYRHAVSLFSKTPARIEPHHMELATSVPNTHKSINRVLLCTSHDSPPSFVFTPGYVTRERADLLREADDIVYDEMHRAGMYETIWQFPVVLLPFGTKEGGQSIVLRPIESQEAMTANAVVLPEEVVKRMTDRICALNGIDCVFVDLSNKPPGTIEWE
ncbi:MAG TPA: glutamine-hydrolyzing GMP synthase [Candidatus Peribacteraceae bacterium]|nr:glutamine-hydrolyzing GMP synthase [Candidatus Peribacteraceae bacterium]